MPAVRQEGTRRAGEFRPNTRKRFLATRAAPLRCRLLRAAVGSPSLERFRTQRDAALGGRLQRDQGSACSLPASAPPGVSAGYGPTAPPERPPEHCQRQRRGQPLGFRVNRLTGQRAARDLPHPHSPGSTAEIHSASATRQGHACPRSAPPGARAQHLRGQLPSAPGALGRPGRPALASRTCHEGRQGSGCRQVTAPVPVPPPPRSPSSTAGGRGDSTEPVVVVAAGPGTGRAHASARCQRPRGGRSPPPPPPIFPC